MNNLKIRRLEDDLVEVLDNSDVEIEVKRLILTDLLHLVESQSNKVILKELQLSQPITEYGEMKDAESTRCEQE